MPRAWTQLHVHVVFSTKGREPLIDKALQKELYAFLGGMARELDCSLVEAGGMPDHVHLLLRQRPDVAVSELVRRMKSRSSTWINRTRRPRRFYWQEGYGAFAVSRSNVETVATYIRKQEKHHKSRDYISEFLTMLSLHDVEYNEDEVYMG